MTAECCDCHRPCACARGPKPCPVRVSVKDTENDGFCTWCLYECTGHDDGRAVPA